MQSTRNGSKSDAIKMQIEKHPPYFADSWGQDKGKNDLLLPLCHF